MSLRTGCYYIINVKEKNLAVLPDHNAGTLLVGSTSSGGGLGQPGGKWSITQLSNGRYTIQNVNHTSYASTKFGVVLQQNERTVEGKWPDQSPQQFVIKETSAKGQYTISTMDSKLFWNLPGGEMSTPIELTEHGNNSASWWTFKSPSNLGLYSSVKYEGARILSKNDDGSLLVENEGIIDGGSSWIFSHITVTDYVIQDADTEHYLSPNSDFTRLTMSSKRYSLKILDTNSPGRYRILAKNQSHEWRWTLNAKTRLVELKTLASLTQSSVVDPSWEIRVMNPENPNDFDYNAMKITPQEFIGRLNSMHPEIQVSAIRNLSSFIVSTRELTDDVLKALVLLRANSNTDIRDELTAALGEISKFLTEILVSEPKKDIQVRRNAFQLLEYAATGQKDPNTPLYNPTSREIAHLIDALYEDDGDNDILISTCRILSTVGLTEIEADVILANITPLLFPDRQESVIVEVLGLLQALTKLRVDKSIFEHEHIPGIPNLRKQLQDLVASPRRAVIKIPAKEIICKLERLNQGLDEGGEARREFGEGRVTDPRDN